MTIVPSGYEKERWMKIVLSAGKEPRRGKDLFFFSGFAKFDPSIHGTGNSDSDAQKKWVSYNVTDMRVGPRWDSLEHVCPMVVVAGHDLDNCDEADAMGYEIIQIEPPELVEKGGVKRIELSLQLQIRGGADGKIPRLAYNVSAYGKLSESAGNEGEYFRK
jgi:hypothetical protein